MSRPKLNWVSGPLVWFPMVLYVAPLIVAWSWWDPLDLLPYLLCLAVGAGATLVAWRVWWRPGRTGWQLYWLAWAPLLTLGLGLGSNVLLDTSAPTPHSTRFLGFAANRKGPTRARFASWRTPGKEERLSCSSLRVDPFCAGLQPNHRVVVTTRRGALGWEWVTAVAP